MKKVRMRAWVLAVLGLALSSCNILGIPVIGIDENGNPTQVMVPEDEYTKRLQTTLITVNDSAIPVLDRQDMRNGWMLRTMGFGLGVDAEIGIGPWKVGAIPHFRVFFTNSTEPTLP